MQRVGTCRNVSGRGDCQSIDSAPASHTPGELGVQEAWSRLAIDVTHYAGRPYLSMVDCGPGRFVVWRETATEICHELDKLFYERGPADELLMDNALAFRSQEMLQLMEKWGVRPFYRAAYRAGGNGIVERSNRTIKTMAERSGKAQLRQCFGTMWLQGMDNNLLRCRKSLLLLMSGGCLS